MGKEKKLVSKSERKNIFSTRKSIVASKNIEIGEKTHPKFRMGKILFKKLNSK